VRGLSVARERKTSRAGEKGWYIQIPPCPRTAGNEVVPKTGTAHGLGFYQGETRLQRWESRGLGLGRQEGQAEQSKEECERELSRL